MEAQAQTAMEVHTGDRVLGRVGALITAPGAPLKLVEPFPTVLNIDERVFQ